MIEVKGNLWTYPADVRVITTNGSVKRNGECVMGRGCAAEAKRMFPGIAARLGAYIDENGGNIPHCLHKDASFELWSFPVKRQWFEKADINLIRASAEFFVTHPDAKVIVMPRPGCGNGHLRWEDVKPVLEPILDDRFHVITQ